MAIAIVGLDLAKHGFQVHAVDEAGRAILRWQLRRAGVEAFFKTLPPCIVGMEACASAHHWARRISALGHTVPLCAALDGETQNVVIRPVIALRLSAKASSQPWKMPLGSSSFREVIDVQDDRVLMPELVGEAHVTPRSEKGRPRRGRPKERYGAP